MLLRSRTLGMHVRFGATLHAPRVVRARNSRSVGVYPARSYGVCTIGMRPHLEAIPHAPRVVYPRNARSV